MRIGLTGISGTLGTALTKVLAADPANTIVGITRDELKAEQITTRYQQQHDNVRAMVVSSGLADVQAMGRVFRDCDVLIHAAALKRISGSVYATDEIVKTNVMGTRNVLSVALDCGIGKTLFVSSDKACVHYRTPIRLRSGSLPIGLLVKHRLPIEVETLGEKGITVRTITNWYESPVIGRDLYKVSYEGARSVKSMRASVILTGDHRILTTHGWKRTDELTLDSQVVTAETIPNDRQFALVIGTLLGDSCLIRAKGACRGYFRMGHAADQREYLALKERALQGIAFNSKPSRHPQETRRSGKQEFFNACTTVGQYWSDMANDWYVRDVNGRNIKTINWQAFSRAWEISHKIILAAWYMDDGCLSGKNARIATHGFRKSESLRLAQWLTDHGFECAVKRQIQAGKHYWFLSFTVQGTRKLCEAIGAYVPESMRYKLIHSAPQFNERVWELGESVQRTAKVIVRRCYMPKLKMVYCLQVPETENFISNGLILHNCEATNLYGSTKFTAECLAVQANVFIGPCTGGRVSCVRYGNVLGSRGSVVGIWQEAARNRQPLQLTDGRMTRFVITLTQAVEFCLAALKDMIGGEIIVPLLPPATMVDLALAICANAGLDPDEAHVQIQSKLRPGGEKLSESLLSAEEPARTVRRAIADRHGVERGVFVIHPSHRTWSDQPYAAGEAIDPEFQYRSDIGPFLSIDKLQEMLQEDDKGGAS